MKRLGVNSPLAVLILAVALFGFIAALGGYSVWQGYRDATMRAQGQARDSAQVVAANIRWLVEASRQALRRIDDTLGFRPELMSPAGLGDINQAIGGLPRNADARVFDARGRELLSTAPARGELQIADREYFQRMEAGESFVVSKLLIDRVTGKQSFVIGQRLVREEAFAGAAVIVIPAETVGEIWASLDLGEEAALSIVRDDGWIVARQPSIGESVDTSGSELFRRYRPGESSGSYLTTSVVDGRARIVGFQKVENAPIIVATAVTSDYAFGPFRKRMIRLAAGAVPALLALLLLSWWVMKLLSQDDRRRTELEDTIAQNRLLLREVHHRVKNNLQTIASLVRLHPLPADSKRDLTRRIAAMATVHEQIYKADRFGDVKLGDYLANIAESVRESFGTDTRFELELTPVMVSAERAMVVGLIVSELVSNSIKHAFSGGPGTIFMSLREGDGDMLELVIADNGSGFAAEGDRGALGLRLVRSFVTQVGGDYTLSGDRGMRFEMRFPARVPEAVFPPSE
ncbi:MAG: sensor histidine kinase [Flavobacteriaceae bacterium]